MSTPATTPVDRVERRSLRVLASAQVVAGIGFFVGIAVISLLGRELAGTALSGLPGALGIAGSALAAPVASSWMARAGRRPGLVGCFVVAAAGSVVIAVAAAQGSFVLLCIGATGFGIGNTAILLARYAAADLSPPERRARSISTVLLATAVGAVLGPNLAGATAGIADAVGTVPLGGPFVLSAVAYLIAAVVLATLLRPDPLLVAQERAEVRAAAPGAAAPAVATSTWAPLALVALTTLVAINVAMIAIMSMTPLHLEDGGGTIEVVGLVISLHLGAMFLPSPITGWLSDRYGRLAIIGAGAVTMFAAGTLAAVSGPHAFVVIAVALVLLGLGWNMGLVSASALLIDATPEPDRPRAQGFADLAMSFAGGAASFGSGLVLEHAGFATLGLIGAGVGIALVATAIGSRRLVL